MFDLSRDYLHLDPDNASRGHHHPRTLSRTKSSMHTCLGGMPGLSSADLGAMLANVSLRTQQSTRHTHPKTEEISRFFDRFYRKILLCCLVPLVVV